MYSGHGRGWTQVLPFDWDKIVRYVRQHQIFMNESLSWRNLHQGLSNKPPEDIQEELVRSVPGLENTVIANMPMRSNTTPLTRYNWNESRIKPSGISFRRSGQWHEQFESRLSGLDGGDKCKFLIRKTLRSAPGWSLHQVLIDDLITRAYQAPSAPSGGLPLALRHDNAEARLLQYGPTSGFRKRYLRFRKSRKIGKIDCLGAEAESAQRKSMTSSPNRASSPFRIRWPATIF